MLLHILSFISVSLLLDKVCEESLHYLTLPLNYVKNSIIMSIDLIPRNEIFELFASKSSCIS